MPLTDVPLALLREYRPEIPEPDDFERFWSATLDGARALARPAALGVPDPDFPELLVQELTFSGFGGEDIKGWVVRPKGSDSEPRPAVVEYIGYNGGRGLPAERLHWAASGYVHVVMDTRGQGSGWGNGGVTPDPHGSGPAPEGYMTRGIDSPHNYYYRRVFTDAALLVEAVAGFDFVDATRIAVTGTSQGGGISLAAAALSRERVAAVMPDVPFLCDFRHSVEATPTPPFTEIVRYLAVHRDHVDMVFSTLSYFDGALMASKAAAPSIFSVALMDGIVLPSSVFAAFNAYGGADRTIEVYPFNGHEGGQLHHWVRQRRWLAERFAA
jgi:cephalosporin-C deacetylase